MAEREGGTEGRRGPWEGESLLIDRLIQCRPPLRQLCYEFSIESRMDVDVGPIESARSLFRLISFTFQLDSPGFNRN